MHWPDAGTQSRAHRVGKNLEGPPTDRRDMQPCSLKKNYPFFLTLSKVSERKSDKIFHKLHSLKTKRRNPVWQHNSRHTDQHPENHLHEERRTKTIENPATSLEGRKTPKIRTSEELRLWTSKDNLHAQEGQQTNTKYTRDPTTHHAAS
jgi:hypothetical protein